MPRTAAELDLLRSRLRWLRALVTDWRSGSGSRDFCGLLGAAMASVDRDRVPSAWAFCEGLIFREFWDGVAGLSIGASGSASASCTGGGRVGGDFRKGLDFRRLFGVVEGSG